MSDLYLILTLITILIIVVGIRLCIILQQLSNDDEEHNYVDEEWPNEDYLRYSKYFED